MKDKTQELWLDLTHDAPITGNLAFGDTTTMAFFDEDGHPLKTLDYKIVDGQLRVILTGTEKARLTSNPLKSMARSLVTA